MKSSLKLIAIITTILLTISQMTYAQKMASTFKLKRNYLIEKGTGQVCSGCPKLDSICQAVAESYPCKGMLIEYHVGPDARYQLTLADYTTKHGDSLYNTLPFTYNMMVNRYDQGLPYGYTYIYNQVQGGADDQVVEDAEVNLAMNSTFDANTRLLTVNVEGYYTADSKTAINCYNIALTEDSLISKQTDARVSGLWVNNYNHMHVFRGYINGMWGDNIKTTTKGTLVTKTYTCTVPAKFKVKNCHLILFATEDLGTGKVQKKAGAIITAVNSKIGEQSTGVNDGFLQDNVVLYYPNPTSGSFKYKRNEEGNYRIDITDILGNIVFSKNYVGNSLTEIDLSAQPKGMYLIRTYSHKGSSVYKLLKSE
ncbi:MAG: Omp28-related outer membrane protein [Bacteroidetes bacterium]|nr:Omp28-related outer membrane protein [Bacteroidota bacterium]